MTESEFYVDLLFINNTINICKLGSNSERISKVHPKN